MISHVSVCLLAHEEKGLISNTFCHAKREYSFSVRPIGCTPAFVFLLFISCESKKDSFLEKIVRKYTGNDFMNIEKTNDIYKKAFGIEIRKNLNAETWDDLLDIVNLRNMIVHNNGQVDKRFESTSTFRRWKDRVDIPLIKIEDEDIAKLLSSVIDAVIIISNLYLKEYYQRRNRVIANYYFNKENAYDFFADME